MQLIRRWILNFQQLTEELSYNHPLNLPDSIFMPLSNIFNIFTFGNNSILNKSYRKLLGHVE